jgi:hypothetical protein
MDFPWYVRPDDTAGIEQGDFLFGFTTIKEGLVKPELEEGQQPTAIKGIPTKNNLIIISHTCDIEDGTLEAVGYIQLLPVYSFPDFVRNTKTTKGNQGYIFEDKKIGVHLLEKCDFEGFPTGHFVIDFMDLRVAPLQEVKNFLQNDSSGKRLRLSTPYLEKMTQRFAHVYMRVGLPEKLIPPEKMDPPTDSTVTPR